MTTGTGARGRTLALVAAITTMLASGCGAISSGSGAGTSEAAPPVPGVTKDVITLGVLTDLTGTFAAQGALFSHAFQAYWDTVNTKGGVCGRSVHLQVADHNYQPQKAVAEYGQLRTQVLAMQQVLGSSINTALLSQFTADRMLSMPAAYSSDLLANEEIVMVNATYDYQTIAGLDWLLDSGAVKHGDKVGHIYFQGDYGANALRGSQHVAEKRGLTIVPAQITPAQTEVSAQVAALKAQGVTAILLSVGPKQTVSAAQADVTTGLNVPLMGNDPTFTPAILKTPASAALLAHYFTVYAVAPPTDPSMTEYATAFRQKYAADPLDFTVANGFASGIVMRRLLHAACRKGEPTRQNLYDAFRSLPDVNTGGALPSLDFTRPGASPTTQVRIYRPDPAAATGLKAVTDLASGKDADAYRPPALTS